MTADTAIAPPAPITVDEVMGQSSANSAALWACCSTSSACGRDSGKP